MMEVIEESRDFAPVSLKMTTLLDVEMIHDAVRQCSYIGHHDMEAVTHELARVINKYGGRTKLT